MVKIVLTIDGMMCGMCDSHINDAVRNAFKVKKVTSSHKKGQIVIIAEQEIEEEELRKVIDKTGYELKHIELDTYEKKGLLGFGRRS